MECIHRTPKEVEEAHQKARDVLTTQADKLQKRIDPKSQSPLYLGAARELIKARNALWIKQQEALKYY